MICPICEKTMQLSIDSDYERCITNERDHEVSYFINKKIYWIFYQNIEIGFDNRYSLESDSSYYYLRYGNNWDYICIPAFEFEDSLLVLQRYKKIAVFL